MNADPTLDQAIDAYFECERQDFPPQRSPWEREQNIAQGTKLRGFIASRGAQVVPRALSLLAAKLKRYRQSVIDERDALDFQRGNPVDLFCINCEHLFFDIGSSSRSYLLDSLKSGNSDIRALAAFLMRQHVTQSDIQTLRSVASDDSSELVRAGAAATLLSISYPVGADTTLKSIQALDNFVRRFRPDKADEVKRGAMNGSFSGHQVAEMFSAMARKFIPRVIARG